MVQHYLLAKSTWTAADVASAYINEIRRLHELSRHLTSDRGAQFAYQFYKELNCNLNIKVRLSTTYQLQTDGLREQAVQTRKQYLRIYCHHR